MSTWVIGDIQGCYEPFMKLLEKIECDPSKDELWLVGDLINRGSNGLEVLKYLYSIEDSVKIVLGNHDISLIATYFGLKKTNPTIEAIISYDKCDMLMGWLREQPFVHIDKKLGYAMAHAGISPQFTLKDAKIYSDILQSRLQSPNAKEWLSSMIKSDVAKFEKNGSSIEKESYALASFTRMRYCYEDGALDFKQKGSPKKLKNEDLYPWFDCPKKVEKELKIIFGHWSTLGLLNRDDILATDTGCVWSNKLTAVSLPDERVVQVKCNNCLKP
jgi:bis(5'-nucleosyl)-tetraphosphatase (symmetrical)